MQPDGAATPEADARGRSFLARTSRPAPRSGFSSPARGTVIAGKYLLEGVLGRGGMGNVWAAHHLQLEALVAVKLIHAAYARDPEARARFEREARAAARLRSQHVVQVHDHGIDGDSPFMVMELLEGEDLHARLRDKGRLSLPAASAILTQMAKGLSCAHGAGVVHRDLKPANIFLARVDGEEVVKILDFGVAKSTSESACTTVGALVGSPEYMSPEQASGSSDVGPRSDLWSLAAILFRAVTGAKPFGGTALGEVITKICRAPIPRVSDVAPDLPRELDAFFARAFDRNPNGRFGSAREMAAAFAALVASFQSATSAPAHDLGAPRLGGARSLEIEAYGGTLTQVYRPISAAHAPRGPGWRVAGATTVALCVLALGGLQVARWRASSLEATLPGRPAAMVVPDTTAADAARDMPAASPATRAAVRGDVQAEAAPRATVAPAVLPARRRAPQAASAVNEAPSPASSARSVPRARAGEERLPVVY